MLEQHLRVAGDRHQRVVEVVGEAARHLAHRVQALLLDDRALGAVQLDGHRGLLGDAVGQAQIVHREGVCVPHPRDRENAEQLVTDLHGLDEQRGVRQQVEGGLVEAWVGLAVARLQRGPQALDQVDERIVRSQREAGERLAQVAGQVVAGERDEAVPAAGHAPCHAGVGAQDPHHLPGGPSDRLGEIGGGADRLADREQRLGLLQPLLDLVVQPRLLQRHRGLGRQRGGQPDLVVGEDVQRLEVVQDQDARGAALVDERHHEGRLGLEEADPARRHAGVAARIGDHHRLLPPDRLQQERGHLLETEGAEGLGPVARGPGGSLVGELRADRDHELPRLVAQEDRAAVDAAGPRGPVGDHLEQLLLLERGADGLGDLEHPVGLLGALLDRLEGLAELLGGPLQLLGPLGRTVRGGAGLGANAAVAAPGGGQEDQAQHPTGGERHHPREVAPALEGGLHAERDVRELDHAHHAGRSRTVDRDVEVARARRGEGLPGGARGRGGGEAHRHPTREGLSQLDAVGVLADHARLHRPHHVPLRVPHLDLHDAGQIAHEASALVGPALGAARALAREQLGEAAAVDRAPGDGRGLRPLRFGDHLVQEPAQAQAERAGEQRDADQPEQDGTGEPAQRYPRHDGLPWRSSAPRLATSSGRRSAETGRAKK